MELIAGFVGVKQDAETGRLEPQIGWAVVEEDEYSQMLTRLGSPVADEQIKERTMCERHSQFPQSIWGVPKEFIQLMDRFENGQQFFWGNHTSLESETDLRPDATAGRDRRVPDC